MLFESLNISQHFRTLYALVSRPSCSTGKVAAQHRKTPYRAAQSLSAWVHASEKSRSLYFSCCLSGQMHGIWLRSTAQGAEFRSYPLRGCRVSLLPFALPRFRVSARVTLKNEQNSSCRISPRTKQAAQKWAGSPLRDMQQGHCRSDRGHCEGTMRALKAG